MYHSRMAFEVRTLLVCGCENCWVAVLYLLCSFDRWVKGAFFVARERHNNGEKREWAIACLQKMADQQGRIPKKEDFDVVTRSRIKAFLGPWPRALEAAGLKEAKPRENRKRKRGLSSSVQHGG